MAKLFYIHMLQYLSVSLVTKLGIYKKNVLSFSAFIKMILQIFAKIHQVQASNFGTFIRAFLGSGMNNWYGQTKKYRSLRIASIRVLIKFRLSRFVIVLFNENQAQFHQGVSDLLSTLSILLNILAACPPVRPVVQKISVKFIMTLLVLTTYSLTVKGLIFSKLVSFEPSVNKEHTFIFVTTKADFKKLGDNALRNISYLLAFHLILLWRSI